MWVKAEILGQKYEGISFITWYVEAAGSSSQLPNWETELSPHKYQTVDYTVVYCSSEFTLFT